MADTQVDPLLIEYLASRDVVCPLCKYSLHGVTRDVCPECGHSFELSIEPRWRSLAWFASGLTGLACGLGFNSAILGWAVWYEWHDPRRDFGDVVPCIVSAPAFAIAIWAWTRGWRQLANSRRAERAALIVLAWAFSAASVIWFSWNVR